MDDLLEALGCLFSVLILFASAGAVIAMVMWLAKMILYS